MDTLPQLDCPIQAAPINLKRQFGKYLQGLLLADQRPLQIDPLQS